MHMPNLVKYFLYSAHVSGNWVADGFIALLRSEIHCARNFTRNFFWASECARTWVWCMCVLLAALDLALMHLRPICNSRMRSSQCTVVVLCQELS
jgi:hypothetical protein